MKSKNPIDMPIQLKITITHRGSGLREIFTNVDTTTVDEHFYCMWRHKELRCHRIPIHTINDVIEAIT